MMYDAVQQSIEEFVRTNWTHTPIAFDNVEFSADANPEFLRCNIRFGDSQHKAINRGNFRQIGLLMLSVFVVSGTGSDRKLTLARLAAEMIVLKVVRPVAPLVAPPVKFKETDLFVDNNDRAGRTMAQVSSPFYYDTEVDYVYG